MIAWSEINAKCDEADLGYRDRIVTIFRQYEGQDTDEIVRGKVVKVTQASFSRHRGIKQQTFSDWIKASGNRNPVTESESEACVNDGIPARNGFVHEVNQRLTECIPLLRHLSADTHELIREDIAETRRLLDEIESQLKVREL